MRAKVAIALLATVAAVALVLPSAAGAAIKPASRQTRPSVDEELAVHGTHGFTVKVTVHDRHHFVLSATKAGHGLGEAIATYEFAAHQQPGSDGIRTRIGNLGRVDVRFVPESLKEVAPFLHICHGGKTVLESGHWVGLIAFRGEQGYTQVRVHRAKGSITKVPPLTCHVPATNGPAAKKAERETEAAAPEGKDVQQVQVDALLGRHVALLATRISTEGQGKELSISSFVAAGSRRRGRIDESSVVFVLLAPGADFSLLEPPEPTNGAVLKPPAPFSGSATFRRHPKGPPSWTGNLKVELPGFGVPHLAGRGTHALLCETETVCEGAAHLSATRSLELAAG